MSNPNQIAYEQYATEQLTLYLKETACQQTASEVPEVLQSYCKLLVDVGRPHLQQLIAQKTQRHNFIFFSIYYTNLPTPFPLPNYQFETLGILQKFYLYNTEEL